MASASEQVLERVARRVGLAAAARIRVGCLTVVLPDGSRHVFGDRASAQRAEIRFHDRRALAHMLLHGETGAGEAYVDGGWSSPDLPALLELAALNRDALALSAGWWRVPGQMGRTLAHRARRNTRAQARRNIAAHYDLSNELYRLFLDETLTYSSAVFETPDQSLADAQRNKYRLIAEGAGLRRGMHVLEIGSGWGGFALYAAGELGCRVTTITISRAQAELARERVRAAGLDGLVDVQLRDYREIHGTYDAVVSIEMLEAVGAEYYGAFFRAVRRGACAGRPASASRRSPSATTPTRRSAAGPTGSSSTSSRAASCRRWRRSRRPLAARACCSGARATSATLRDDAAGLADAVPRAARRRPRPRLRRAVHPDVGVLPGAQRGRLQDRPVAGPPARLREAPRYRHGPSDRSRVMFPIRLERGSGRSSCCSGCARAPHSCGSTTSGVVRPVRVLRRRDDHPPACSARAR